MCVLYVVGVFVISERNGRSCGEGLLASFRMVIMTYFSGHGSLCIIDSAVNKRYRTHGLRCGFCSIYFYLPMSKILSVKLRQRAIMR